MKKSVFEECVAIVKFYNLGIEIPKMATKKFRKEFCDKVDWVHISWYQNLSEGFIREFADKVDWDYISCCQKKLSEGFIREFADKVNWEYISRYQHLSEGFIREFSDKLVGNFLIS
jgi:hypothetical protein